MKKLLLLSLIALITISAVNAQKMTRTPLTAPNRSTIGVNFTFSADSVRSQSHLSELFFNKFVPSIAENAGALSTYTLQVVNTRTNNRVVGVGAINALIVTIDGHATTFRFTDNGNRLQHYEVRKGDPVDFATVTIDQPFINQIINCTQFSWQLVGNSGQSDAMALDATKLTALQQNLITLRNSY